MEFENEFTVPVSADRAWSALMDVDQVATCMPGATLLENEGDRFTGKVKVKVGPITVSYNGAAEFVEKDQAAGRAVLTAKGREERGAGTAGIRVTARLEEIEAAETRVKVLTDLDITGKPAQFGRGVMAEVGTAIINKFATNLATQLAAGPGPELEDTAVTQGAAGSVASPGAGQSDSLDLGSLIWAPTLMRAAPVLAGVAAGLALAWCLRGRETTPAVTVVFTNPDNAWSDLRAVINPV